ncbi:MAG: DsbA family protein [Dehalococcoidia bacterium]|nr:DsbA family protein [Dehalococcoidia bacterium]
MEWLGFEIHPDTPHQGTPVHLLPWRVDVQGMLRHLRQLGAPVGITFNDLTLLALEAAEFAKEHRRFEAFHSAVFDAYYLKGQNIGNLEILAEIGQQTGLDRNALENALLKGTYKPVLNEAKKEALKLGVSAAPTFIIEGKDRIVGAQPLDIFRNVLRA